MTTCPSRTDAAQTSWTLVDEVRAGGPAAPRALNELSKFLYPPVVGVVRSMVNDEHTAEDLTQQFFLDVVLWRSLIERADREQGRLRTVVRQAARNFVRDHWRRQKVRQNIHGAVSLDALDGEVGGTDDPADPEFESIWLDSLCTEACRRCEDHFRASELPGHWTLFERARLHPAVRGTQRPDRLADIYHEHGFESVNQARGALDTVFKRLRALLLEVAGNASLGDADRLEQIRALQNRGLDI